MQFNSIEFLLLFFPVCLVAYYGARKFIGHSAALVVLTTGSLVFYSWWDIANLPLLLISAIGNYWIGRWIAASKGQHALAIGITLNLIGLGVFKYANFIMSNLAAVSGVEIAPLNLALPLGISFFTFQQISYLVDVGARKTQPGKLLNHLLFVSFFPHLIAGPLVQHSQIARQFSDAGRKDDLWDNFGIGLSIFAVGIAKKVLLADNLEPFAAAAFGGAERGADVGLMEAWLGVTAYTLQIFFDFSGYSDMAIGLARCFGYHLPINFSAPYKADSIIDFWRRWHISLSQFLRDHLYIPLGGNRKGETRRYINLMLTMLLGGLWHGAAWTFVIWGGLHGAMLAINHLWEKHGPVGRTWLANRRFRIILVFLFVAFAWIFFRATSFSGAIALLESLIGLNGLGALNKPEGVILVAFGLWIVWALPDTAQFFYNKLDPELLKTAQVDPPKTVRWQWTPSFATASLLGFVLFVAILNSSRTSEFIYFAF